MSILTLYSTPVHDHRSTADLRAEHAVRSAALNPIHPFFDGKVEKREISPEERAEAQARIDNYHSNHAFLMMEAANDPHWNDD
jgi:hypothetical protein